MSLFGIDVTGAGQAIAPTSTQQGVVDQSKGMAIQGVAQQVTNIANVISGVNQAKQSNKQNAVLGDYALQLTQVAEKVEQGLSRSDARSMIRNIYNENVQAYGSSMLKELNEVHKQVTSASGLANNFEGESFQQELINKEIRSATESGFYNPSGTPESNQKGLVLFREQKAVNARLTSLESQEKVDAFQYQDTARQQVGVSFTKADTQIEELVKAKRNGLPIDANQVAQDAAMEMARFNSDMALYSDKGVNVAQYQSVMQDKINMANQIASGQLEGDALAKRMTLMEKQSQMAFVTQNPDLAAKLSVAKIVGSAGTPLINRLTPETVQAMDKLTSDSNLPDNNGINLDSVKSGDQRVAFDMSRQSMAQVNAGGNLADRTGVIDEVNNVVNNTLKGINAYQMAVKSPEKYTETVNFIQSDEFADYVSKGAFKLDASAADQAKMVLKQTYETGVVDVAARELDGVKIATTNLLKANTTMSGVTFKEFEEKPATEVFIPELVDGKVVFKISPDDKSFQSSEAKKLTGTGFFARLNGSLNQKGGAADMMSMSMRAITHLGRQTTNYEPDFRNIMISTGFKKAIIDGQVVSLTDAQEVE